MLLAYILLALAVAGTLSSWVFLALSIVGAVKFHRDASAQRRQARSIPDSSLPPVSLLKPVHGMESRLRENIESFFHLDYPNYEIIFCVARDDDPVVSLVRELITAHPEARARLLIGDDRVGPRLGYGCVA